MCIALCNSSAKYIVHADCVTTLICVINRFVIPSSDTQKRPRKSNRKNTREAFFANWKTSGANKTWRREKEAGLMPPGSGQNKRLIDDGGGGGGGGGGGRR